MNAILYATDSIATSDKPLGQLSDEDLLLRYRRTEEREVFAELVRRYETELYNYLRRQLNSAELAEDAFQAAFLQVHVKCWQFEEGRRFRPWLYAIATNQAIDAQRRLRRHRTVSLNRTGRGGQIDNERHLAETIASGDEDPLITAGNNERNELLRRGMEELSDQMRTVIHLVFYQGLKYREAAEIMAVPVGTVKSRVHAAVAKLTEFWNRHHPDLD